MNILINACQSLGERLLQADRKCRVMLEKLSRFESDVSSKPPHWIKLRLEFIALQIMQSAVSLYEEHGGKGFVFVMLTETILKVHWEETDALLKNEDPTKPTKMRLLSVEEARAILTKLGNKVESGSFTEAIDWMNKHTILGV